MATACWTRASNIWLADIRDFATEMMMQMIRDDLAALGVQMDVYSIEKALYGTGKIEAAINALRDMGLIYEGTLEPPKGKTLEDWEPRVQTLFRSTAHGDDVDRPVMKSDGSWTYFAPDIAYHYDKVQRGFDELIDIFGADHGGYVKRMKAAVSALSDGKVPLDIKLVQLVKLYKNGEPFKMSKRAGTFVTLRDVVEQAGADVTRFMMLTRKNDVALDFDFAKVLEQSKDNPVFYVQYANARINSVLRKSREAGIDCRDAALAPADLAQLEPSGRDRDGQEAGGMAASGRDRRARATSRTGSRFTSMNWPRNSTACGTRATTTPAFASCKRAMRQHLRRKLPCTRHGRCDFGRSWYPWRHSG